MTSTEPCPGDENLCQTEDGRTCQVCDKVAAITPDPLTERERRWLISALEARAAWPDAAADIAASALAKIKAGAQ